MKIFKERCVEYKGGKCEICGYNYSYSALDFHHKDPSEKEFNIAKVKLRSFENNKELIQKELDKCILLCANCHRETHEQYTTEELLKDQEEYLKLRNEWKQENNNVLICKCGKAKSIKAEICISCKNKNSIERNPQEVLEKVKELGFVGAGKYYGITDNAIRKFLKVRNLL